LALTVNSHEDLEAFGYERIIVLKLISS
jgi:hypothetical protein